MSKSKWINILFKNLKGSSFKYNGQIYELVGTSGTSAVTYTCFNRPEYKLFNNDDVIEVINIYNEYNDNDIIK